MSEFSFYNHVVPDLPDQLLTHLSLTGYRTVVKSAHVHETKLIMDEGKISTIIVFQMGSLFYQVVVPHDTPIQFPIPITEVVPLTVTVQIWRALPRLAEEISENIW